MLWITWEPKQRLLGNSSLTQAIECGFGRFYEFRNCRHMKPDEVIRSAKGNASLTRFKRKCLRGTGARNVLSLLHGSKLVRRIGIMILVRDWGKALQLRHSV